jgi:general secretion pathway protein J
MTSQNDKVRPPSPTYSGERAGERGKVREASDTVGSHVCAGPAVDRFPAHRAARPSHLPSPRRTGKREDTPRARHRGFSLLELLLAMGMAAMLALSLYMAMNVTIRARRSAFASLEPSRAGAAAIDLVQRDFESVPPPTGTLSGPFYGEHQAAGSGDNDSVEFCSIGADPIEGDPADASPLAEGVRRIEFYVTTDGPQPALVRRVTRNLMPASEPYAEEEILARGVRSFSLRYFDGTSWQESWDSTTLDDSLPFAVAITLEMGDARSDTTGHRVTRVVPLACAKPLTDTMSVGGVE